MATYWHRKCASCGYSVSGRVTSSSRDGRLGPPLVLCPKCNHAQKTGYHKEWIQMSTLGKLFCVTGYSSLLFVFVLAGCIGGGFLASRIDRDSGVLICVGCIAGGLLGSLLAYPFAVKSNAFLTAYAYSLYRTDNEAYRKLLDLPEPTEYMTAIPFYTLQKDQADQVAEIRGREHKDAAYYSPFDEQ